MDQTPCALNPQTWRSPYIMPGFEEYDGLLKRLGKHSTGKSCLYVKKLADVDAQVLRQLVVKSARRVKKSAPK